MALPIIGVAVAAIVGGAVSLLSFGPGAGDYFTRSIYDVFPSKIAGVADFIRAYKKGTIKADEFYQGLKENGFDQLQADLIARAALDNLSIQEIVVLWFRFKNTPDNPFGINKDWLTTRLNAAGVDPDSHDETIEANRPVPTINDVISFAQREAYEPEAVALGKLDEGLPEQYIVESRKRGLSDEDARMFWRVHWNYPSLLQGFEMFQRLYDHPDPETRFTQKDLETYYNIADIAPGMRKRATAIAYRPIGRVDIRRFDAMGVYGVGTERKTKLIRAYRENGFALKDAEQQAEFTLRLNDRDDREFTRAQILDLYRNGLPKDDARGHAKTKLLEAGYDETRVELMLQLEDRKIIDADEQSLIDSVEVGIAAGRYKSDAAIRDALTTLDMSPEQINQLVRDLKAKVEKENKPLTVGQASSAYRTRVITLKEYEIILAQNRLTKESIDAMVKINTPGSATEEALPSKSDLTGWYADEIIDAEQFQSRMLQLRFDDEDIKLYAISVGRPLPE